MDPFQELRFWVPLGCSRGREKKILQSTKDCVRQFISKRGKEVVKVRVHSVPHTEFFRLPTVFTAGLELVPFLNLNKKKTGLFCVIVLKLTL